MAGWAPKKGRGPSPPAEDPSKVKALPQREGLALATPDKGPSKYQKAPPKRGRLPGIYANGFFLKPSVPVALSIVNVRLIAR